MDREKDILDWCKKTYGEYEKYTDWHYSTETYVYKYKKRNWLYRGLPNMSVDDLHNFWPSSQIRYEFYPFEDFIPPIIISKEEDFFLSAVYLGELVHFIRIDLENNYVSLFNIKVKYIDDMDKLNKIVNLSREYYEKYFKKVTLETVLKYEEDERKKQEEKNQQAVRRMRDEIEVSRRIKRYGAIILSSLLIGLTVYLILMR